MAQNFPLSQFTEPALPARDIVAECLKLHLLYLPVGLLPPPMTGYSASSDIIDFIILSPAVRFVTSLSGLYSTPSGHFSLISSSILLIFDLRNDFIDFLTEFIFVSDYFFNFSIKFLDIHFFASIFWLHIS